MALPKIQLTKASKSQAWLRMGISGPAGAGKTLTSLIIAQFLGGKTVVIDTQSGQSNHYGNQFDFEVQLLDDHHPDNFVYLLKEFVKQGYQNIIIDSVTHEWTGTNGCLQLWDQEITKQRTKNTFTAWKAVTPLHDRFFETVNNVPANVIGTIRSKMDHVQERNEATGKTEVKKVGMGSVQRENSDYEFDVLMEIDIDHVGIITKCRDGLSGYGLDGKAFKKPGKEFTDALKRWMEDGGPRVAEEKKPLADADTIREIERLWPVAGRKVGDGIQPLAAFLPEHKNVKTLAELPQETATAMLDWLKGRVPAEAAPKEQEVIDPPLPIDELPDPRYALLDDIEELRQQALAAGKAPGNVTAEIKRQMGHAEVDQMNAGDLAKLKEGMEFWLKKTNVKTA